MDPVTSPRNSQLLVGGKLAAFHHQWAQHFPNHHELIRKVSQGLLISFWDEAPPLLHGPLVLSCNNKAEAISLAVQKLLKSQAIEEVQDTSSPEFYSRLFFVPKPYGSLCPIIDLKVLNQYLEVPSFKMEILFSIAAVTTPGMDCQNRFEGCLPTYHSTSKYPQVLPACGKLSDLPVQGTSIWPLYSTQGVYEDSGTCSTAPGVLGYTDSSNLDWIFRASSPLQA